MLRAIASSRRLPGDLSTALHWGALTEGLAFFALLAFMLAIRVWGLTTAPPNVTGDEVTFLNDVLRIIHTPHNVGLFSLMADGNKPAINFYIMSWFVRPLPEVQAVLGMRLASSFLSLAALGAFYLYVRTKVAIAPAMLATLLLGASFVFLNFSRGTWMADGHGLGLAGALLSFFFVEWSIEKRCWPLAVAAGLFAGLALYGYQGMMLAPAASLAYFGWVALRRRLPWRRAALHAGVFAAVAALAFLPQAVQIGHDLTGYARRAKATSITTAHRPYYGETSTPGILWHQAVYTARGFLLLDPTASGQGTANMPGGGIESQRYGPAGRALVDPLSAALFFSGIATLVLLRRKDLVQPAILFVLTLVAMQLLTQDPPNFARGLFALPFVYMVGAVFLDWVWSRRRLRGVGQAAVAGAIVLLALWNVRDYSRWMHSPDAAQARQPAIKYDQVGLWVLGEKQALLTGQRDLVISWPNWQELLKSYEAGRGRMQQ